jgi:hypothetical protein
MLLYMLNCLCACQDSTSGQGGIALCILNPGTWWSLAVTFMSQLLYLQYPVSSRMGELLNFYGHFGEYTGMFDTVMMTAVQ